MKELCFLLRDRREEEEERERERKEIGREISR